MRRALLLLPLLLACGADRTAPAVDAAVPDAAAPPPAPSDPCADYATDATGAVAASYANMAKLFDDVCAGCHYPNGAGELDLRSQNAWANLVNRPALPQESCGGTLVVPGDPGASYLWQKLSTPTPCYGLQMPRSDIGVTPLAGCALDMVRRWIAAGAPAR